MDMQSKGRRRVGEGKIVREEVGRPEEGGKRGRDGNGGWPEPGQRRVGGGKEDGSAGERRYRERLCAPEDIGPGEINDWERQGQRKGVGAG